MDDHRVEILGENAGEFRVYVAQYWSKAKQRRVREYADAVPAADLAEMSPVDRQKVLHFGAENLPAPSARPAPSCAPSACAACKSPCP